MDTLRSLARLGALLLVFGAFGAACAAGCVERVAMLFGV